MKKVKIDDNVYLMPEGWDELTLEKFQKILFTQNPGKEALPLDLYKYNSRLLSILLDCSEDVISKCSIPDVTMLMETFSFYNSEMLDKKVKNSMVFNVNNKTYGFDILMEKLTFGQFIDLDIYLSKDKDDEHGFWKNIDKIMAILIRPAEKRNWYNRLIKVKRLRKKGLSFVELKPITKYKIEDYDIKSLDERAETFRKYMTMDIVNTVAVFFCLLKEKLQKNIQVSLPDQQQPANNQEKIIPVDRYQMETYLPDNYMNKSGDGTK